MPRLVGTRANTNQKCPESGLWLAERGPGHVRLVIKGNRMGYVDGAAVVWILIQNIDLPNIS